MNTKTATNFDCFMAQRGKLHAIEHALLFHDLVLTEHEDKFLESVQRVLKTKTINEFAEFALDIIWKKATNARLNAGKKWIQEGE